MESKKCGRLVLITKGCKVSSMAMFSNKVCNANRLGLLQYLFFLKKLNQAWETKCLLKP